jgi:hypothetical protein
VESGLGSPISKNPGVAQREIADIYTNLRDQALGFGALEIKAPPPVAGGRMLGVVMDMGYDTGVVTLLGLADGTTSMYVSNGGGKIGLGDHAQVAEASRRWVEIAESAEGLVEARDDCLPGEGLIRFNFLTTGDRFGAAVAEAELAGGSHPLSSVFLAGQQVITQIRLVEEATG